MNTPTPRTDKFVATWDFYNDPFESIDHAQILERELTAVTEQRDEALDQLRKAQVENDHNWQAMELYESEREQRDRLAEALANLVKANETWNQGMMDVIGRPPNWNQSYLNEAKEALQSLTPNAEP